jgi:DNA ligase (NAD+)
MVGSGFLEAPGEWKKEKHEIPMGSLDKIDSPFLMTNWVHEHCKASHDVLVTEKLDGISIELIYDDGFLIKALTRNNGLEGYDIAANVVKMHGVKTTLKGFSGSLRGEILLRKSNHKKYFPDYANPRNAASGISKRLDGEGCEHLDVFFYQLIGDNTFLTEVEQFYYLQNVLELQVPQFVLLSFASDVNELWQQYQDDIREKLDYDIDGLVVRVSDIKRQQGFGESNMRPKGAIAYKFAAELKHAVIKKVEWHVGNSGRITPIANVTPTKLCGAVVEKASLHNIANIKRLEIGVGAVVLIKRANDVIPYIEKTITPAAEIEQFPKYCPECNSATMLIGEYIICPNTMTCPAQIAGRIKNWVKGIGLLEWGESLINKLVDDEKIADVADLYKLDEMDLSSLERMGEKSAKNALQILNDNRQLSFETFFGSLSIPFVGKTVMGLVANAGIDKPSKLFLATLDNLIGIPGLGKVKAESLYYGIRDNKVLIMELLCDCGISLIEKQGALIGKTFAFTGAMVNKRAVLEKLVSDSGGSVKSSVGKDLNYLVMASENLNSTKAMKANKLGIQIITEEEFLRLAGQ